MPDEKSITWHTAQAHSRALTQWAQDLRGVSWVPAAVPHLQASEFGEDGQMRIRVHLEPFLLHPDWDTPRHPSTWLVELVDGPRGGGMHTIPWPSGEVYPPAKLELSDPAGGAAPLPYYLRDTDAINGIARYTTDEPRGPRVAEDVALLSSWPERLVRKHAAGPGGDTL